MTAAVNRGRVKSNQFTFPPCSVCAQEGNKKRKRFRPPQYRGGSTTALRYPFRAEARMASIKWSSRTRSKRRARKENCRSRFPNRRCGKAVHAFRVDQRASEPTVEGESGRQVLFQPAVWRWYSTTAAFLRRLRIAGNSGTPAVLSALSESTASTAGPETASKVLGPRPFSITQSKSLARCCLIIFKAAVSQI